MSSFKYTAGLNNVGSYQVSGIPYATGSLSATSGDALKITFPYVTRWVHIINHGATELTCSFSENGLSGNNHFKLHRTHGSNEGYYSPRLELKVTELWFSGSTDFDVVAGLTGLPVERITNISPSGSNWSGSIGIG
jgi:hypothetical protein